MTTAVLELNDSGLELVGETGLLAVSPGYAVLHRNRLLLGEEARQNIRRWPGWTENRFWSQLNLTRLANGTEQLRTYGDLAYLHLQQIWQQLETRPDELILAVPDSFSKQQLGLLLGIANECGLPVGGLVSGSLAAVATRPCPGRIFHLDIELHKVVLTSLVCADRLQISESHPILDKGSHSLMELWCETAAERLIETFRFDPMHDAESEQALYDQIPTWIHSGQHRQGQISFTFGKRKLETDLNRDQLARVAAGFYTQLVQNLRNQVLPGDRARLYVSHRWREFPGLMENLSLLPRLELVPLDQQAVSQGVTSHLAQIRSDARGVSLITTLRTRAQPVRTSEPASTPSHYLIDGIARPLGEGVRLDARLNPCDEKEARVTLLKTGQQVEAQSHSEQVALNGQQFTVQKLEKGDRVSIGDFQLTIIHVSD